MSDVSDLQSSLVLDRYRIVRVAAGGAFGRVFEVVDTTCDQLRALKISLAADARVAREFEQLSKLVHRSLPRVFDVGITRAALRDIPAGAPFFVAEWIAGGRCDERAWTPVQLWQLAADLAGALAAIHAGGLVHGDVAPQNILLADDRAVLVDLGLADAAGARGTPDYMAPEAFAGIVDARTDLFALGAVLARLATGHPRVQLAATADLGERIRSAILAPPPALPELPAPFADLIRRLLARDADARPASARAVLAELDDIAPVVAPDAPRRAHDAIAAAPPPTSWPGASELIAQVAHRLATTGLHIVVGGRASGAREVVAAAIRRWRIGEVERGHASAATRPIDGGLDDVAAQLAVAPGAGFVARTAHAIAVARAPVVIEVVGDPRADELLAALAHSAASQRVIAIAERAPPEVPALAMPALDDAGITAIARAMLGAEPSAAWVAGLADASERRVVAAIELVQGLAHERAPLDIDWATRASAGSEALRAATLATCSLHAQRLALALAIAGGRAPALAALAVASEPAATSAAAAAAAAAIAELVDAGLARWDGEQLAIDRATADAAEHAAGADAIAALASTALARGELTSAATRAALLARAPIDAARGELACALAAELLAAGRPDSALALATRALAAAPARAHLLAARAAAATGAYADARAHARAAADAGADPVASALLAARAAQRAGDLDAAEAALAALHRDAPARDDVAGAYARILVTRARYADALAVARPHGGDGALSGLRAEAAGLASLYTGDLDAADRAFSALELGATAAGDGATTGRALSLRGMVAQQRGQLAVASDHYGDAARRLDEAGEIHAAAVAEANLGTVLAERGRASAALPRLVAASRVFAALGATTERWSAELARANSLLAVGQVGDALAAAQATADATLGAPHVHAFALLVAGDAHVRLGDRAAGERSYRTALAVARANADASAELSAHIALAEAGWAPDDAAAVAALCGSADDRDRWLLARARLAEPSAGHAAAAELARACADAAVRADADDRTERSFRAHALAARLAVRAADGELARGEAEAARAAHAQLLAAAAPAFRGQLAADPELARLPGVPPAAAPAPAAASRSADPAHLRRLLALSRRLNSTDDVDRILDEVIDTAIELCAAERGFLLLRQDGELVPVVSRNFAAADLVASASAGESTAPAGAASVSRSIAERAVQLGQPVVTVDAGRDERFDTAASVAALRLRSVLVVPLRQRGTVIGCIYVDHRLRGGAFDDDAADALAELADIAAIAIDNARLTADLRRSTREVALLASRLSAELADRDAELVRVKADLPDRERLRHRYERIAGRSPAMLRMLEVIDRAAATALPVVIVGESGTGKELVARALHDNGPRAASAFVAINCSAVPEALLESELFGHIRGAFTGAERDRRGLFEVADGGTLFLDEIADTSPAMQAKLLRVLQDGLIRRVGDTQTHKVDVRVIAAAQRPLAELVTAGRFREDLRFRLEVISVAVPPLRERDGDVPVLVERLLAELAPGRPPPRVSRAAMRALGQHRWPGNVRELENALARGIAMGGDSIDITDLPEAISAAAARPEPARPIAGDDLRLKPALHATEQAYISAAMARAKQNQTAAARLLGLSRFGLQKKLRRLAGDGES